MHIIKPYSRFIKENLDDTEENSMSEEEAEALNKKLEENLKKYQDLTVEIRIEQLKLQSKLDNQHKELNVIFNEIHEQMKELNISTKKSDKVVAKLVKQYEKSSSMSYKKLWDKALEELNEENQQVLLHIQETSKVKHNIQEQFRIKVNEKFSDIGKYITGKFEEFLENSKIKLQSLLKTLNLKIKNRNSAINALDKLL